MKCADKMTYNTRGEAWDFVKTVRQAKKRHMAVYIYQCACCGKWHLTHVRPERFKARKVNQLYNYKDVTQ